MASKNNNAGSIESFKIAVLEKILNVAQTAPYNNSVIIVDEKDKRKARHRHVKDLLLEIAKDIDAMHGESVLVEQNKP